MPRTLQIERKDLARIPSVPFTDTWRPVHHKEVIDSLSLRVEELGLEPIRQRYETSQNGMNLFGTWDFQIDGGKDSLSVGFRNSMQKDFALGVVGGHRVLVCSNLSFRGDFVEHRRHTGGLTEEELHKFLGSAVDRAIVNGREAREWYMRLHDTPLSLELRKQLTYDVLAQGIVPPSKFALLDTSYREERSANPDGAETLAHFYGAVTRALRGTPLQSLQIRTLGLNKLLNQHAARHIVMEADFGVISG